MYLLNDVIELNFINTPKFQLSTEEQTCSVNGNTASPELKRVEVSGGDRAREGDREKPSPEECAGET